jgi:hypothetical protein
MTYYSCSGFGSGPRGTRTPGLLNAIETRSQLRYGPKVYTRPYFNNKTGKRQPDNFPVDLRGFEPLASSVRLMSWGGLQRLYLIMGSLVSKSG